MSLLVAAFVGNPNVGKSAWINALSNSHFQVGNWPGVTIEKKEALIQIGHQSLHLIDLPGVYSLDELSNEEAVTARVLSEERIDCLVNVVDASNLSRNLLLTMKLRELNIPMILIFNFMDEVKKQKLEIDANAIARRLSIPIYCGSAFNKKDIEPVKELILKQSREKVLYRPLLNKEEDQIFTNLYNEIANKLPFNRKEQIMKITYGIIYEQVYCLKQLEGLQVDIKQLTIIRKDFDQDCLHLNYVAAVKSCMTHVLSKQGKRFEVTDKLDAVFLHPLFSYPILILVFCFMMSFVFNGSAPYIDFIQQFFTEFLAKYLRIFLAFLPLPILDLLVYGVLGGVGGVLSFLPLMALLFFFLGILEESGYMSRISFLLDKGMRVFHLSGKAFLNLLIGFGCNVPAIYATRTLDTQNQKKATALLIPFMSCSARLPVYLLFASAFFREKSLLAILSVMGIGILLALILASINAHYQIIHDDPLLIMEMPVYRFPRIKVLLQKVQKEVRNFIKKAFTVVLLTMILLWGFTYFPNGESKSSYLAVGAKKVAFIFEPLGFGTSWELVASLPSGISAKESVVGFLSQLIIPKNNTIESANLKEDSLEQLTLLKEATVESLKKIVFISSEKESDPQLTNAVANLFQDEYAHARAFSFMVFICLTIPCVMTLVALKREFGWKLLATSILIMLVTPYLVCLILYQTLAFLMTYFMV